MRERWHSLCIGRGMTLAPRRPVLIVEDGECTVQLVARLDERDACSIALRRRSAARRNVELLARLLRGDGFVVEIASGGREAREFLEQTTPTVLVTDVTLPSPTASYVARVARRREPLLPLFFVTSYPFEIDRSGFDPPPMLFTKPLDYARFCLELRRATRRTSGQMLRVTAEEHIDPSRAASPRTNRR